MKIKSRSIYLLGPYLLPLMAWFYQLIASFVYSTFYCESKTIFFFHIVTLEAIAVALIGLAMGWRAYRESIDKFSAIMGIFLGAIVTLIIAVGDLGNFLLEGC